MADPVLVAEPILVAERVGRRYETRRGPVIALAGIDLRVGPGELVVLRGPSGSGKSTLLLALGGMRRPTTGRVRLGGEDLYALSPDRRRALCGRRIGFVFQTMHLLPYLDAESNVALAVRPEGRGASRRSAGERLAAVGLEARAHHRPGELSVGERQRVALARALVHDPDVVLADEPTGNLDADSAARVLSELDAFRRKGGAVVMATHGRELVLAPTRELVLEAGRPVSEHA